MKRLILAALLALVVVSGSFAGHTRPGYVDGGQSADGRYVVTAEQVKEGKTDAKWRFTWHDTRTGEKHSGWLVGVPFGLDHFRVAYTHIFVPPGGETFAVWQPASWSPCDRRPPPVEGKYPKNPSREFKDYVGFGDRLVIYKKTGQVIKRLGMKDILHANEWMFVNWVQGNLYWLREYPEMMKNGEPPRCGYRYYRISPDYSVLEFTIGPNSDAVHKVKEAGAEAVAYRRVVRLRLSDGSPLGPKEVLTREQTPVRPFIGELTRRASDGQRFYRPSLDPVRVGGKVLLPAATGSDR